MHRNGTVGADSPLHRLHNRAAPLRFRPQTQAQSRMTQRPLWLLAAPVIFLLLWSAGFGIAKLGLQHAEPLTLLALRYTCVLALLLPLALILRPPLPKTLRAWGDVGVTGFLIQVVYFGLCYVAFKSGVSAGAVAIIVCLQPVLVALGCPVPPGAGLSGDRQLDPCDQPVAGNDPRR